MKQRIVLASASPRRKELLEQIGLVFDVIPAKGEEQMVEPDPASLVKGLAYEKALEVKASVEKEALVIGADTIVAYDGKVLGKPKDEADARQMLGMLRGKTHQVYTGVAILGTDWSEVFYSKTDVEMYDVSDEIITDYIATKEPMDKAGAYGIQGRGAILVKEIRGDYNTVVGLPAAMVWQELYKHQSLY